MTGNVEQVVILQRDSRGKPRYHLGYRAFEGPLTTAEACNVDQSGNLETFEDLPDNVNDAELCNRCWGR